MSILFSHFFQKINQIAPLEDNFTEVLDAIALKPKTLYFYGKMPENVSKPEKSGENTIKSAEKASNSSKIRPKTVAIVGSRHNTKYGEEVAYKLSYELAKRGAVIVSGLAYGIDSIAHRGCLDAGGKTVAVLGTPIDKIYPKNHVPLAAEILEKGGAVMSEYAPGEKVYPKSSFLVRNRLISGLSDVTIVVEAAIKSGSLSTAAHALSQGKTVFAVPGNITSPYSQGCNKLISEGAIPLACLNDVLREVFPEEFAKKTKALKVANLVGDTDLETKILQALASGLRSGEDIMKKTLLPPEIFNSTITLLEIKSRIRPLGLNNWALI